MTKEKTQAVSPDGKNDHSRQSPPNPSGAARRRLLRAVGGSGGVALGVLLAGQWQKPIVKAVVLPAHAQTSPVETVGCLITVLADLEGVATGSADGTMQIFVQDGGGSTELGSVLVPFTASAASLLVSSMFPPGTYDVIAGVTRQSGSVQNWTVNWSCCDASLSSASTFGGVTAPSDNLLAVAEINDDGQCELNSPG